MNRAVCIAGCVVACYGNSALFRIADTQAAFVFGGLLLDVVWMDRAAGSAGWVDACNGNGAFVVLCSSRGHTRP